MSCEQVVSPGIGIHMIYRDAQALNYYIDGPIIVGLLQVFWTIGPFIQLNDQTYLPESLCPLLNLREK